MIIMIVGIIFTLVIPLQNDRKIQEKMKEAIRNIQIIARADIEFYQQPGNGYYIFEHTVLTLDKGDGNTGEDLLNIQGKLEKIADVFYFNYSVTDTTVAATTNINFGKEGAVIYYYLPNGPWNIGNDKISQNVFDPNWLP